MRAVDSTDGRVGITSVSWHPIPRTICLSYKIGETSGNGTGHWSETLAGQNLVKVESLVGMKHRQEKNHERSKILVSNQNRLGFLTFSRKVSLTLFSTSASGGFC